MVHSSNEDPDPVGSVDLKPVGSGSETFFSKDLDSTFNTEYIKL